MNSKSDNTVSRPGPLRRIFQFDLRSLAFMRIAIGILILVDLGMRWPTMEAMYTDEGFFSTEVRAEHVESIRETFDVTGWSIHALNGSMTWQVVLFLLAGLAAVMMIVGWHTRVACIIGWVLLVSLHSRNPIILHSGDCLLRLTMFWSMFLPLGAVWSLDAKRNPLPSGQTWFSGGNIGLVLTLFSLYFFPGIAKLNPVWFDGDAMEFVLRLDIYATTFGKWMLDYPETLKWVTWVTLVSELVLPFFLFIPWKHSFWRSFALVSFCLLHVGIAACMNIGLFSFIAIATWSALLPAGFWNFLERKKSETVATANPSPANRWSKVGSVAGCLFAASFMTWHIANINPSTQKLMPTPAFNLMQHLNMRQTFHMFDVPPEHSPWFVYEARLESGVEIDIFRNRSVSHDRPDSVRLTIPHHHWRRLHRNLARPIFSKFREPVSQYLIRRWNATHDESLQVKTLRTIAYLDEITPRSDPEGQVVQVWHQYGATTEQQLFDDLLEKMKSKGVILP